MMKSIKDRPAWAREALSRAMSIGLSLQELADACGYHYRYVSNVLSGHVHSRFAQERILEVIAEKEKIA